MSPHPALALALLAIASATLVWTAITDFREFRIPNEQVLLLAGLYFAYALASGTWVSIYENLGYAALIAVICISCYAFGMMGGGDVKMLPVAALWTGPAGATTFAVLWLIFALLHYGAARLGWVASKRSASGTRLPLAPSVSAALIGVFALGVLAPNS